MAISTIKVRSAIRVRMATPVAQREVRIRTAADIWKKIRGLNESDADRMKITAAYLQLGDVLELLPDRYRIALGGSME